MADVPLIIVVAEGKACPTLLTRVAYRAVLVGGIRGTIDESLLDIMFFLVIAEDAEIAVCELRRIIEGLLSRIEVVHLFDQGILVSPRTEQILKSLLMEVSVLGQLGASDEVRALVLVPEVCIVELV